MRTETIKIYTFSELPEEIQEKVIEKYRYSRYEYSWSDEWRDSMKEFIDQLGISVSDWRVSPCGTYINWTYDNSDWDYLDDDPADTMTGLRLRTWVINNWLPLFWKGKYYLLFKNGRYGKSRHSKITGSYDDCPLTGYCGDQSLIQPILAFVYNPQDSVTLRDLIGDCLESWTADWQSDMEWQDSDKYIQDEIEADECEFYADGSMV